MPVVAINNIGRGRVMTIASDSFWKYAFRTGGDEELRGVYYRFWKRSIRWLINDNEFKQIKLKLSKLVIFPNDTITIKATVFYNDFANVPIKNIKLIYEKENKKSKLLTLNGNNGLYYSQFTAPEPGNYKIKLTVTDRGKDILSEQTLLLVKNPEAEEKRNISINKRNLPGKLTNKIPDNSIINLVNNSEKIITLEAYIVVMRFVLNLGLLSLL